MIPACFPTYARSPASTETTQAYTLLADEVADTEIRAGRRKREASRG